MCHCLCATYYVCNILKYKKKTCYCKSYKYHPLTICGYINMLWASPNAYYSTNIILIHCKKSYAFLCRIIHIIPDNSGLFYESTADIWFQPMQCQFKWNEQIVLITTLINGNAQTYYVYSYIIIIMIECKWCPCCLLYQKWFVFIHRLGSDVEQNEHWLTSKPAKQKASSQSEIAWTCCHRYIFMDGKRSV